MKKKGYNVGKTTIGVMLHKLGYSLQANKKTLEDFLIMYLKQLNVFLVEQVKKN